MYDFLLVSHCNYSSILYHLRVIWRWIISWPIEIWFRGHSRSLKLVGLPFKSFGAVSYSPSMTVSVAVCEILSAKEWCDLEKYVKPGDTGVCDRSVIIFIICWCTENVLLVYRNCTAKFAVYRIGPQVYRNGHVPNWTYPLRGGGNRA